jgi:hypothetical protein
MPEQLVLLDPDHEWSRLDEHTREIGRQGVAEVRRILSAVVQAQRAEPDTHDGNGAAAA